MGYLPLPPVPGYACAIQASGVTVDRIGTNLGVDQSMGAGQMETVYPLTPEEHLLSVLRKTLGALLKTVPPAAEQVLRRRFGMDNPGHGKTLAAIGAEFQVTRERIRQIEQTALNQLRLPHCIHSLQQVFDLSHVRPGPRRLSGKARSAWGPPRS